MAVVLGSLGGKGSLVCTLYHHRNQDLHDTEP